VALEVERVEDEERFFGGDIAWWALLLLVSIPVILIGLSQIPATGGFVILSGFVKSLLIVFAASVVIAGIALLYNMTLPVPNAPPDVMFKPPISGG
jgi:hypothetical protein